MSGYGMLRPSTKSTLCRDSDLAATMNPAWRELLGKDRSTSETGHGLEEAMNGAQFRNVVGFLGRPTTTDRRIDAMGRLPT